MSVIKIGKNKTAMFHSSISTFYNATPTIANFVRVSDADNAYTVSPSPASLTSVTFVKSGEYEISMGGGMSGGSATTLTGVFSTLPNWVLSGGSSNFLPTITKNFTISAGESLSMLVDLSSAFSFSPILNTALTIKRIS